LERLLNLRLGLSPSQDTLPARFIEEPLLEGPSKGEVIRIGGMVQEYYQLRKWDPVMGYPSEEKLNELGIANLKSNLQR